MTGFNQIERSRRAKGLPEKKYRRCETHNITEKITSLVHKTYTFEEFNDIAARGWVGEFKPYEF